MWANHQIAPRGDGADGPTGSGDLGWSLTQRRTTAGSGARGSVLTNGLEMTPSDLSPTSLFRCVVVFFFVILGELFKICVLSPSPVWQMSYEYLPSLVFLMLVSS